MSLKPSAQSQSNALPYATPADPMTQSLLNQSLREQLQELTQTQTTPDERTQILRQSFSTAMASVFSQQASHSELSRQFEQMYQQAVLAMQQAKISEAVLTRQYVHETGLILSPLNCSHTLKDIYRISAFAQGLKQALDDLLQQQESVHLLYPACGPFAPLLLPLLSYLDAQQLISSEQLTVTLVDLQPGAVQSLRQLVADLALEAYIGTIAEADAVSYTPLQPVDILLLEAMQHGLSKEGHISIAHHLCLYLSEQGVMLPQTITVNAALVLGQQEYVEQWREVDYTHSKHLDQASQASRVELGTVFSVTKASLAEAQTLTLNNGQRFFRCNALTLPAECEDSAQRVLALYATLTIYAEYSLDQYDSGITHPLPDRSVCIDFKPKSPMPDDLLVQRGDTLAFFYRLNGLTGFMPMAEEAAHVE